MNIADYIDQSKIYNREIDRLTYARDASIYRIMPEFAVRPENETDIVQLFKYANHCNKSITFRASGTSLSGQTLTNGIVAEIAYGWNKIQVISQGKSILVQPGVIGEHANQALKKYDMRIGPDPASIKAARIGGIVANNASGMITGKPCDSYHTMKNIRFILANGNIYDTTRTDENKNFAKKDFQLADAIKDIRDEIRSNNKLIEKIINKYRLKNTIGYSLNSFIDYDDPLDIFSHLLIGSEGTLGFVSNIELETIPDPPCKSTGLILFDNIIDACNAIPNFISSGVQSLELMDYACLKTAQYITDAPYDIEMLPFGASALLCEFQDFKDDKFKSLESSANEIAQKFNGNIVGNFVRDEKERLKLWKIRKSLFATVGSMRKSGTSIITEDLCFDIKNLGSVINDLHELFRKWKYDDAVIFGHAKDGNLHFNLSIDLESENGVHNYHGMMEEVAKLTIEKYNGSLKAEHGTGRNMAPYVEYEWGNELYDKMWRIKVAADPNNILNPGVILNKNKNVHIDNLKPMPDVHHSVDLCVECGFCEPVCPSREFTFTPRNRITVSREIKLLEATDYELNRYFFKDYNFKTQSTCAVDGMCEIVCPININTGDYVKELRKKQHGWFGNKISKWLAHHFQFTTSAFVLLIKVIRFFSKIFGQDFIQNIFINTNSLTNHRIYSWNKNISAISKEVKYHSDVNNNSTFIYFPSCISRSISANQFGESLVEIMKYISSTVGVKLEIPKEINDLCCGAPFGSKGYENADKVAFEKTIEKLYTISNRGTIPIMVDTSTCNYKFINPEKSINPETLKKWKTLIFIDIIPFLVEITENIEKPPIDKKIVLHPTCSTHKMDHLDIMIALAQKCALHVVIPQNSSCCGFAGDRGLKIPELSKNANQKNKQYLYNNEMGYAGYSSSRFCEIGSSTNNNNYVSIALLVREYLADK